MIFSAATVSAYTNSVIVLAAGDTFSLALRSDGIVRAWGWNKYDHLSNGNTISSTQSVPVSGLTGVKALAASGNFGMALKNDGMVWAWGNNGFGQLRNGSN